MKDTLLNPETTDQLQAESGSRALLCSHLDLFSGIGGFALAAKWHGMKTVAFCEIDPWARRILNKNFPGVPIHGDVNTITENNYGRVDLLTGGFPCQPYSGGGRMRGKSDDRDCLPGMLKAIEKFRPRWVLCENSPNVLKMVFDEIKTFMESISYEVGEPLIIPACAVNADHRRDRAWICAYANTERLQGCSKEAISRFAALPKQPSGISENKRRGRCVSSPGMLRNYNGIPYGVDRIKGLGNAIHPGIAYEILGAMISCENAPSAGTGEAR